MPWRGPEYEGEFPSLGWALIDLAHAYLRVPAGLHYGQPLTLSDRQIAFIIRAYRVDPVSGRSFYRRCIDEGAKGVGKSPQGAVIGFGELVGPVVFDGWDANGNPVGRPHPTPLVQVAATAEDQTGNLYGPFRSMLAESPAIDDFRIDLGKTRIELIGREGRMEPVTTSAGTREGQPVTCALKEETQYWTETNGGWQCDEVLNRNVGKNGGRSFSFTNTYRKGLGSVAERDADAAAKGTAGVLYQAIRGPFVEDLNDREILLAALAVAYQDSPWVDLERIADECVDPAVRPGDARRFYLNIPDELADESWLPDGAWEDCREAGVKVDPSRPFSAGVDMALKHDTTALRRCQSRDDGKVVTDGVVFLPSAGEHLDVQAIEAVIREWHQTGNLRSCAYDPAYFERSAQVLLDEGVPMEEYPQTAVRMVPACGHAYELVVAGKVVHDDDEVQAAQVVAGAPKTAGEGWRLSKGRARQKIDSAIAFVMALDIETLMSETPATWFGGWE